MNPREFRTVVALLAVILIGGGGFVGYTFVISPLQDVNAAIAKLNEEIEDSADKEGLETKVETMKAAEKELPRVKRQSLPPNEDVAKAQYVHILERLLIQAKIKTEKIPDPRSVERRAPITPELASKKPAYLTLVFSLDMDMVNIWQVSDFLQEFYKLDLLHQITEVNISREKMDTRNGLKVHFTIEAIILDGAEPRSVLFPTFVGTSITPTGKAVAAVAGALGAEAVAANPDLEMKFLPAPETTKLATRTRDYSLLAKNDIFYGVLPSERQSNPSNYKDDIAAHIRLVMLSESTEGNSSAFIMDIANPFKYTVNFSPKDGIQVARQYTLNRTWKKDSDYEAPQGVLKFSDDNSRTKRTLKIIAFEENALIVEDLGKPEEGGDGPEARGRGPGGNGGPGGARNPGGPGGGGNRGRGPGGGAGGGPGRPAPAPGPAVAPGARPATPGGAEANATGLADSKVIAALPADPVLYRWTVGKSLKDLEKAKLPSDEARKILSRVAVAQKPGAE